MKKILWLSIIFIFSLSLKTYAVDSKPLAAYKIDSLWYFVDSDGKSMFNPLKLVYVAGYSEGFYKIYAESGGTKFWAFMNDKGEMAVPLCDEIRYFRDGMAMIIDVVDTATDFRLYGFVDKQGRMAVSKNYIDATDFSEGLAWVMNREKRGYIDRTGKMVIPWDTTGFGSQFSEGLAAMTGKDDRFGFINKKGEVVIDYQYDEVTRYVNGLARVNILSKWGFIDTKGNLVIKPKYDYALDFVEGFCFVGVPESEKLTPLWGVINRGGGEVVDFQYEDIRDFSEGIGAVKKEGKWKFIDYFGNQIINKLYNNCDSFSEGLAWAEDGEQMGYINPLGEFVFVFPKEADAVVDLRLNKKVK
jgi:hypothetical protein